MEPNYKLRHPEFISGSFSTKDAEINSARRKS